MSQDPSEHTQSLTNMGPLILTEVLHAGDGLAQARGASEDTTPWARADIRTLTEIARQVENEVTARLLERCDALLEEQIHQTLTPVLERLTDQLSLELRTAVPEMVRNLVVATLAEELGRRHSVAQPPTPAQDHDSR